MTSIRVASRPRTAFIPRRTGAPRSTTEASENMRRLFETPFGMPQWPSLFSEMLSQPLGLRPPFEVVETPDEFTVTAELPGLDKKDIHVEYEDGILTIRGEKEETKEEKKNDRRYLLWERSYGSFERSFSLDGVEPEKVTAGYRDGVLSVHLPKTAQTKSTSREVPIG
jgi:HSP20 family protein